jgi:hypothetical protein
VVVVVVGWVCGGGGVSDCSCDGEIITGARLTFGASRLRMRKRRHFETSLSFHTVPYLPTITPQQHDNGIGSFFHIKYKHECTFSSPRDQSQRCSFRHRFTKRITNQSYSPISSRYSNASFDGAEYHDLVQHWRGKSISSSFAKGTFLLPMAPNVIAVVLYLFHAYLLSSTRSRDNCIFLYHCQLLSVRHHP